MAFPIETVHRPYITVLKCCATATVMSVQKQGRKRDLFYRDRDDTETFRDPDRDVFRDVANGTAC